MEDEIKTLNTYQEFKCRGCEFKDNDIESIFECNDESEVWIYLKNGKGIQINLKEMNYYVFQIGGG